MCTVEQIADCGDILSLGRSLFIPEKEDKNWLSQCYVSLSSCGNLLAVGFKNRLCLLTTQWISAIECNTFIISWSGTLPAEISAILTLPICPSHQSSQNGPDWFCIIVGCRNGNIAFYTNTGHLLMLEKLDDKPVMKISCHTGTYGTLPDDIHILFQGCVCVLSGASLFQTLRNAKAQLARVQAGIQDDYVVDNRNINIRKWSFSEQESINDASVVGLDLKNTFDHFLAASTYGGYDTWYRSIPPVNSLILTTGTAPYTGFHYALEGGTTPPLQDVARAVANKIKSALPGWLGGGSTESITTNSEPVIRSEILSMRNGIFDAQRHGTFVAISPDRRLAALADNLGRVAVLDVNTGYIIKLFKGYRDAQCAFVQIFDTDNKKPQLTVVKDIRRAIFLIIYNPKKGTDDASNINYNDISPWWQGVRDMLVEMRCPLRSMIVAMACKAVASLFEGATTEREDAWESVTKENAKWGILIGKLEDISILSITLMFKGQFNGKSLPKLPVEEFNINLKYIYTRGKGSVTELIAKWLCSMGVLPEAIVANELIDRSLENDALPDDDDGGESVQLFLENSRVYVNDNQILFKWLSLLRRQFPLSNVMKRDISTKTSSKLLSPRMKFLTKLIRSAVDTITCVDSNEANLIYNNDECSRWMENISNLAELWNIEESFVKHQYVVGLYHMGYDGLAESVVGSVADPELLLVPIVAITIQRLKRSLERCKNQPEWIVTVPPQIYKRLQNTTLDVSIPANPSLAKTMIIIQRLLSQVDKKSSVETSANFQNIKLAELIVETCEVLIRRNLA
ncbi:unnamed protein product, partial [Iphiclides podalirius]